MKLAHFYHLYAQGSWEVPVSEHLLALEKSGLGEELSYIGVGIVGSEERRSAAKRSLPSGWEVVAEENVGFEQVSHNKLAEYVRSGFDGGVLYMHSKGSANHRHDQDNWRKEMTDGVIYHWRECVDLLDQYDSVGCRWRSAPFRHYSGTFWWATSDFLRSLAPISYTYRDDAEAWIGQSNTGGTMVEIDSIGSVVSINPFGRTFVCKRDKYGHSYSNPYDIGHPLPGDEFVNFPPIEGNRIISHLMTNGATFSIKGNTIIVESVKTT